MTLYKIINVSPIHNTLIKHAMAAPSKKRCKQGSLDAFSKSEEKRFFT
jgi:hypothetical protein